MDNEITDSQSFRKYIDANSLVFVDFYTTWCEPCKLLDQILDRILSKMPEGMKLLKLDSDEFPELAENLQIKSAPVLFIFRDGKEAWRMNGFMMDDDLLKIMHDVSRETSD
jgi:thioredoxin 1